MRSAETFKLELKLFDGFLFDSGFSPLFHERGLGYPDLNRVYVAAPEVVKHELYAFLLEKRDIAKETELENLCKEESCFAAHLTRYDPHSGLCEKHKKYAEDMAGARLEIHHTLFCHRLKEKGLTQSIKELEKEFTEHVGVEIESSFSRSNQMIKDKYWLFVYDNGDEITSEYDEYPPGTIFGRMLFSIRPFRDIYDFELNVRNRNKEERIAMDMVAMTPFISQKKMTFDELLKQTREVEEELLISLESSLHSSRLEFDEENGIYTLTEHGSRYLEAAKDFQDGVNSSASSESA